MAAGRPHGPNDPSLETAVRKVRRPGPVELAWNWRWELGLLTVLGTLSALIATSIGLNGLAVTAGAGLAAGAATLLCCPPARQWITVWAEVMRTDHPERLRPTHQASPGSRRVAGDSLGDAEGRDTRSWPSHAHVPDDGF